MADEVRALCFPRDDDAFASHVQRLVEAAPQDEPVWAAVEALLRKTYPMALISPRLGMATLDRVVVWYVYRDGTFAAAPSPDAG